MSIVAMARTALTAAALNLIYKHLKDYIREDIPELAKKYEKELEAKIASLQRGDKLSDEIEIAFVDDDYWYPSLRYSDLEVSVIPGLKIDLLTGILKVSKKINLHDSSKPPVTIDAICAYTFQITFEDPNYSVSIGGGRDYIQHFSQYLADVRFDCIPLNLKGYYAESQRHGFIISVETDLPFPVPLANTGLGLCGVGLTYGERFAPRLSNDTSEDPIEQMRRASAQDYVNWARQRKLMQWSPTQSDVRIFGMSTDIGDLTTSGCVIRLDDCGFTYIASGPVVVFGGKLVMLRMLNLGQSLAAIDIPSQSVFLSNSVSLPVTDLLTISGRTEYSASLKDPSKTWLAIGGYSMNGARVELLNLVELWGGKRLIPLQSYAMRAGALMQGTGEIFGFGGGFSFSVDVMSSIGWNPIQLEGQFSVEGRFWAKLFGREISVSVQSDFNLRLPQPLQLKFLVTFSIKIWFATISKTVPIFNLESRKVQPARAALAIVQGSPISFIVLANGAAGVINDSVQNPQNEVPPDISFDIPFECIVGGVPQAVNGAAGDGSYRQGSMSVSHRIASLKIERIDEDTGAAETVPVSAAWLGLANGETHRRSSRLAVPCANPLAWMQAYEYASPPSTRLSHDSVFQTFGSGPNEDTPPTRTGADPELMLGQLRITAQPLCLRNLHCAKPYERALFAPRISLAVLRDAEAPATVLPISAFELRFVGASPPRLEGEDYSGVTPEKVRDLEPGYAEWSVIVRRDRARAKEPLVFSSPQEWPYAVVAIGYEIDVAADFAGSEATVLQPGVYELSVEGESHASCDGVYAGEPAWAGLKERFRVIAPRDLRPYLRYATNGDERAFAKAEPGWNPNPSGVGFGHYQDHLGVCRARVGYLSRIFPSVFLSLDHGETQIETKVVDCTDGTLAGSVLSRQWDADFPGSSLPEQEFLYTLPTAPANYHFSVLAVRSIGGKPEKIDGWPFRVSRYRQPDEHLMPALPGLCRAYGPFGTRAMQPAPRPIVMDDLANLAEASLVPGWGLPNWLQRATGLHADSGLTFLRIAEWIGLFKAPPPPHDEKLLIPPQQAELCILSDTDARPAALLWRTAEPLDWRRVNMQVYLRRGTLWDQRFQVRLTPGPDGTSCLVTLLAEAVAIRIPAGDLAVDVTFRLAAPKLPTLIDGNDIQLQERRFMFAFNQPLGRSWPGSI